MPNKPEPQVGDLKTVTVVGVSFIDDYPGNLLRLRDEVESRQAGSLDWVSVPDGDGAGMEHYDAGAGSGEPVSVLLIRNPENEFDENAVQVHVPWLGRRSMIGHIDKNRAAALAPRMDAGWEYAARIVSVNVLPEKPEQPGITIEIELISKATDDDHEENHG